MNAETLFTICSSLILPGWLLLILAPRWKWTSYLIAPILIPLPLAILYVYLVAVYFGKAEGGFGSLAEVSLLFENPYLLLAGWVHYLAFDLFVGSWEVRDAQQLGISHFVVIPCLILTFLFGPIGLLLYWTLRWIFRRKFAL